MVRLACQLSAGSEQRSSRSAFPLTYPHLRLHRSAGRSLVQSTHVAPRRPPTAVQLLQGPQGVRRPGQARMRRAQLKAPHASPARRPLQGSAPSSGTCPTAWARRTASGRTWRGTACPQRWPCCSRTSPFAWPARRARPAARAELPLGYPAADGRTVLAAVTGHLRLLTAKPCASSRWRAGTKHAGAQMGGKEGVSLAEDCGRLGFTRRPAHGLSTTWRPRLDLTGMKALHPGRGLLMHCTPRVADSLCAGGGLP